MAICYNLAIAHTIFTLPRFGNSLRQADRQAKTSVSYIVNSTVSVSYCHFFSLSQLLSILPVDIFDRNKSEKKKFTTMR